MVVFPFFFWPFCCVVQPDICAYCAEVGAERDRDTLETHRIVLPVFAECMRMGKTVPKINPIK
jgi:hypothetical protein